MDHLSTLSTFVRVAETASFTAAARDLGLSKSAVSKQVARLEDRLGVRLINRTTRRLHLTEVGRAYFERARRIVQEAREAELAVMNLHAEPRGTLRINAPMSFGIRHLSPILPEFMRRHPGLAFDLRFNDRRVDLIEEGFDVGIRIASLADSSLVARKVATSRFKVTASPEYWQRHGRPAHPRDLANHDCLIYEYRDRPDTWVFEGPDGPISVRLSGRMRANNGDVLLEAALADEGVYAAPTFLCGEAVRSGALETVLDDFLPADAAAVYALWPHNRHLSAKVRAFVDFLVERFGPEPYWEV